MSVAIVTMCNVPFDDINGKIPHATLSRVASSTRASLWAWDAASARVKHNFDTVKDVGPKTDADLQGLWNSWSSILKTNAIRKRRSLRLKEKLVYKRVYTIMSALGFGDGVAAAGVLGDDECDGCLEGGGGDDDAAPADFHGDMSAAGKLMMGYLETALEVFGFYSIPVEGELKVFQVLQKKKRMITVQTFKSKQ